MGFQDTFQARVTPASNLAFGVSVTLTHGTSPTSAFTAVWEEQDYDVASSEGFATQVHSRDFMFDVTDAALATIAFDPRAGEVITVTENSVVKKFELLPIGKMPAAQLMPGGFRWRVHTKQVE